MSSQTQQQVRELFEAAVELPVSERVAWLHRQTGGQGEVHHRVASLLEASQNSGGFLAEPAFQRPEPPAREGTVIGAYRVVRELGSGGMGIVYLVVRADQAFTRLAALKVIRPELRSDPLVRRFLAEREILARLDHPNIARIVDGGDTDGGLPYFVMDFVDGLPIDQFCALRHASLTQRLNLFRQACDAVEYLHANSITHRDLKPANMLVTHEGMVKLLDFGIARPAAGGSGDTTGLPLLTPGYASPEQILARSVTPAADVYSLGAVLYELLTGARPLNFDGMGLPELLKAVDVAEPAPPSAASLPAVEAASEELAAIRPRLKGDLDAIVLMALRKQPERRYAGPAALAADVERFQQNLPVAARRDSLLYRCGKQARRHALRMAAAAIVAASLALGGTATWKALHYRQEIDHLRTQVDTLRDRYAPPSQGGPAIAAERAKPHPGRAAQLTQDLNGLAHNLRSADPAAVDGPLAPRRMTGDLVRQSLDLLAVTAADAAQDPAAAAALGRAYLAVSQLQWNPDGASLRQPEQAANTCRLALMDLRASPALDGNAALQQVVSQLLDELGRIPGAQ